MWFAMPRKTVVPGKGKGVKSNYFAVVEMETVSRFFSKVVPGTMFA